MLGVRGVEVQVVVAGQEPGRAVEHAGQLAGLRVQRVVVSDDVADEQDAAVGVVLALGQVGERAGAGVLDLLLLVGLDVAADQAALLVLGHRVVLDDGEVHGGRQLAGRGDAAALELGRALGQMVVVELRDVVRVDGHPVAGGLGDEHGHVLAHGQLVAAVLVGDDDLLAVRHTGPGDALLVGLAHGVPVAVVEDLAAQGVRIAGLAVLRLLHDLDLAAVGVAVPVLNGELRGRTGSAGLRRGVAGHAGLGGRRAGERDAGGGQRDDGAGQTGAGRAVLGHGAPPRGECDGDDGWRVSRTGLRGRPGQAFT